MRSADRRRADLFWAELVGIAPPATAEHIGEENWLPTPSFPARTSNLTGDQFVASIASDRTPANWEARENAMVKELLAGNVPQWLQRWVQVRVSKEGAVPEVVVRVLPDYLCVGTDTNYRHVPLDQQSAQKVADAFGALVPTAKICHAVWLRTAEIRRIPAITLPTLRKKAKKNFDQDSTAAFDAHSLAIQAHMKSKDIAAGDLVAGHKKDVVLAAGAKNDAARIQFHGLYDPEGYPYQPCYTASGRNSACDKTRPTAAHPERPGRFSDYSQGVRLLHPQMAINGETHLVADVLKDPSRCTLIAEGPIDPARVPSPPSRPQK